MASATDTDVAVGIENRCHTVIGLRQIGLGKDEIQFRKDAIIFFDGCGMIQNHVT